MSKAWARRFVALAVVVVIIAALGWPFYVSPGSDEPGETDVAYVLGPPTDERMEAALAMLQEGDTGTLMVSLDPSEIEWTLAQAACAGYGDFARYEVLCESPDPFDTRGEAQWLQRVVEERGWDSASVVTFTPHLKRAELYMERCFDGDLAMIDSGESLDPWYWAYQYAYQTGAFMKAGLTYEQC